MAISKAVITSISELAAFLEDTLVSGDILGSVSLEDSGNTLVAADNDGKTVLKLSQSSITVYKSDDYHPVNTNWSGGISYKPGVGIACSNGAIIELNGYYQRSYFKRLLIAKTNNDKVAVIFTDNPAQSSDTSAYLSCTSGIRHFARGDDSTVDYSYSFYTTAANQTKIVPFETDAAFGDVSYTPDAGYMPTGQYYNMGIGKFTFDGAVWITNGYWAIKDE